MHQLSSLEPYTLDALTRRVHHSCPNCGYQELLLFYEARNVPIYSCLMPPSRQEALDFPCGDVALGFCDRCSFITNTAYDSKWAAYAPNYEDQQTFSPTFNRFATDLATRLIETYDLRGKDILEIGCSKGDFLFLLCELGNNRGVGIDPSAVPGRVQSEAIDRVKFISDYYSEHYSEYVGDFICCRHTLEHISTTQAFVSTLRRSIGDRLHTSVFFELPDTTRILRDMAFEDIYYEHCSYFTPGSLAHLFRACGFEIVDLYRAYGDQYLLMEARPVATPSITVHPLEDAVEIVAADVQRFAVQIAAKLAQWQQHLQQLQAQNKRVVVWGSGSKCVGFLTTLGTQDQVEYVVDINPHRHGEFIPGVGKEIMPPEFLQTYKPDQIIVMNPIYCNEIQRLLDQMGVVSELVPLT